MARPTSYDRLLADFSEHPRTAVLSTHHIDEVANLLEHVVILDQGRVLLDADTDELHLGTGGFDLGIRFFDLVYTGMGEWWQTLIQTFLLILTVMLVGAAITMAFHR